MTLHPDGDDAFNDAVPVMVARLALAIAAHDDPLAMARAAILELRRPTRHMLNAAIKSTAGEKGRGLGIKQKHQRRFAAMLEAALDPPHRRKAKPAAAGLSPNHGGDA